MNTEYNSKLKNIIANIEKNKKVVIYGAGLYGTMFYVFLKTLGLEEYISYYVVSNGDLKTKEDKSVYLFQSVIEDLKNSFVVIAMAENTGLQVQKELRKNAIFNYEQLNATLFEEMQVNIASYFENQPIQEKKIFIECLWDLGYRCNCKYIAEEIRKQKLPVEMVWSVKDGMGEDVPSDITLVKAFSYEFYRDYVTSRIRVGNMDPRGFLPKRKEQYYINTWHGSGPFKKVGVSSNITDETKRSEIEKAFNTVDLFVSNTGDNTQMFRESFLYRGEIYEFGSPRNDVFFRENNIKEEVYERLGIDKHKKLVLYVPTYRASRSFESYDLEMKKVLLALEERFGGEFVLLYRFHYFLYQFEECRNFYPDAVDVTMYSDIQELLVASDVLITDYSSTMWDFSLQDRPVFLYQNDRSDYEDADRGFYCSPKEWPYPKAHSSEDMVEVIRNFDEEKYLEDVHAFINKYQSFDDGHAAERVVERIMDVIEHPEKYGKE